MRAGFDDRRLHLGVVPAFAITLESISGPPCGRCEIELVIGRPGGRAEERLETAMLPQAFAARRRRWRRQEDVGDRSRHEVVQRQSAGLRTLDHHFNAFDGIARRLRMAPQRQSHAAPRSEEHTSELQSLMRISYAVFCLK